MEASDCDSGMQSAMKDTDTKLETRNSGLVDGSEDVRLWNVVSSCRLDPSGGSCSEVATNDQQTSTPASQTTTKEKHVDGGVKHKELNQSTTYPTGSSRTNRRPNDNSTQKKTILEKPNQKKLPLPQGSKHTEHLSISATNRQSAKPDGMEKITTSVSPHGSNQGLFLNDTKMQSKSSYLQYLEESTPPTENDDVDQFNVMKLVEERARLANREQDEEQEIGLNNINTTNQQELLEQQLRPSPPQPPPQAGAYAGAPGESLHRRDDIRFSLVGVQPDEFACIDVDLDSLVGDSTGLEAIVNGNTNSGWDGQVDESFPINGSANNNTTPTPTSGEKDDNLAEAMPVDDEEIPTIESAQPFDLETAKRKKFKEAQQRTSFLIMALVLLLIVAGVIVGVGFHNSNSNNRDTDVLSSPAAAATTISPIPSTSTFPSNSPSLAPSGALNMLREDLPNQTLANLEIFDTPQWKAWDWLLNHHNISNFEEWRKKQLFALATFFFAFEGENWKRPIQERWMNYENDECRWFSNGYGLFCSLNNCSLPTGSYSYGDYMPLPIEWQTPSCDDGGKFTSLYLQGLQLDGFAPSMPPEIALLTSLSIINLEHNDINASLSDMFRSELLYLTNLQAVSFGSNNLTGQLPTELGMMTSLTELRLHDTSLTGQIPSQLGLITGMSEVLLQNNAMDGTIPSELESLVLNGSLLAFIVANNSLSGTIPESLCLLMLDKSDSFEGRGLSFDCSSKLCGCRWCLCANSSTKTP